MTSRYFETADSTDRGKCSLETSNRDVSFREIQINKVHSPTIFCVVLRDLIGFWDASISSSDPTRRHIQYK